MANPLARAEELARVGRFKEALANLHADSSDARPVAEVSELKCSNAPVTSRPPESWQKGF